MKRRIARGWPAGAPGASGVRRAMALRAAAAARRDPEIWVAWGNRVYTGLGEDEMYMVFRGRKLTAVTDALGDRYKRQRRYQ